MRYVGWWFVGLVLGGVIVAAYAVGIGDALVNVAGVLAGAAAI